LLCLVLMLPAGCGSPVTPSAPDTLSLSSTAFPDGGKIPDKYTCEGQDVSPPLTWGEPPAGTGSLALVMEDLDSPGGGFTHWVVFNIAADVRELTEGTPALSLIVAHALVGKNDFGRNNYNGPCPPSGKPHRYQFNLYALDTTLSLDTGASKQQVIDAMEGHILARGLLTGIYQH
jgi:Raf kinase inhibitor-like YbhB/YbcL family protein